MAAESQSNSEGDFLREARVLWSSRNSTLTVVRKILCEIIQQHDEPFSVESLHQQARRIDPAISISTVYRTVAALSEGALLRDLEGRDGKTVYEKSLDHSTGSGHIICQDCGKVIPLEAPCLVIRETATARAHGFSPEKITLRLEASCDEWSRTGSCEHRSQGA